MKRLTELEEHETLLCLFSLLGSSALYFYLSACFKLLHKTDSVEHWQGDTGKMECNRKAVALSSGDRKFDLEDAARLNFGSKEAKLALLSRWKEKGWYTLSLSCQSQ